MTLLIWHPHNLDSTLLPGHLGALPGGADHLDSPAVGRRQGPLTLRLAVNIQAPLANLLRYILLMLKYFLAQSYPVTMIDDLLEAGRFISCGHTIVTHLLLHHLTVLLLPLNSGLLTDHLVLIVTLLYEGRLTLFILNVITRTRQGRMNFVLCQGLRW